MFLIFFIVIVLLVGFAASLIPDVIREFTTCPKCKRQLHLKWGAPPHCDACHWIRGDK